MSLSKLGRGYVGGIGPMQPELMIIGQSVGRHEIAAGLPFSGPAGDLLDESLDKAGISRRNVYLTNVLKYQPAVMPKIQNWTDNESVEQLWEEIGKVNPQKILCLGSIPLYFVTGKTGIKNWRGSIVRSSQFNKLTLGTYNPAHLLYGEAGGEAEGFWQKYLIDFDIKRIKKITPSWTPPYRNLHIARNSLDAHRFFERHAADREVAVDIEVIRCIPCCISFAFRKHEALSIPLFQEINNVQICTIPKADLVEIWRIIDKVFKEKQVVGQNFKFDQERLEHELPFRIDHFHSDTMLKAYVLNPELPKSLAFLASIHTEEPYYKDEGKDFNPKRDKIDQWLLYNAKDAAVTKEISEIQDLELAEEGLYDYYYGYYHHLHKFYYELENIGLNVDEVKRQELILKYKSMLEEVNLRLETRLGWLPNVNSPKDVPLVCQEDLRLPKRDSYDEDSLISLLANHAKTAEKKEVLSSIIEARRLRKILGPDRLRFLPDWDGKAKTLYRICGTETGRSSTAILKPPVRLSKIGLSFQTLSKHGDVGRDFRSMLVPPEGFIFVNQDLSQAEARVVALLSDDLDTLELFDTVDIHRFTAAIYLDLPITREARTARQAIELHDKVNEAIKSISSDERFVAKFVRHGGNYGMKKHRLMTEIMTSARKFHIPVIVSEWKAGKLLEKFHEFTPKIRSIFHAQVKDIVLNTRELRGPFGDVRMFYDRVGEDLYKESFAHIPQNTVAHHLKRSCLAAKKEMPDLQIVVEAHDAILFQCKEDEALDRARIVKKYLETPIDFSECSLKRGKLVIPSDCEIGKNYGELEKVKL